MRVNICESVTKMNKERSGAPIKEFKFGVEVDPKIEQLVCKLPEGGKVLELGPGLGGNSIFLADKGFEVTCMDTDEESIEYIRQVCPKINAIRQDILTYNFLQEEYDLVVARAVLHLFRFGEIKLITENIMKSLKHDGLLYIWLFSIKEPAFERYLLIEEAKTEEKNTFYSEKHRGFRHFFTKDEVEQLFVGNEILELEDAIVEEDHPPFGRHKHGMIRALIRKRGANEAWIQ